MHEDVESTGVNVIGRQSSFAQRDSNRLHDWSAEYSGANVHGTLRLGRFWQRTYFGDGAIATDEVTRNYYCPKKNGSGLITNENLMTVH